MDNLVNGKWRIVATILAIVAVGQGLEIYRIDSVLKNVFYNDAKVTVKDNNAGKILEGITAQGAGSYSQNIFYQSATYGEGMKSRQISGIAYQPREFEYSADGYKREDTVITEDTNCSITLELEPKNWPAEQGGAHQIATTPESKLESKPEDNSKSRVVLAVASGRFQT